MLLQIILKNFHVSIFNRGVSRGTPRCNVVHQRHLVHSDILSVEL